MSNVLKFAVPGKARVHQEPVMEESEYKAAAIMVSISSLIYEERIQEAESLWTAVRESGYKTWIQLSPDLCKLVDEANYGVGMLGTDD